MEKKEYISSVIYEGLLYGSGLAIGPFLLAELSPEGSHYAFMLNLAVLSSGYHLGDFVGKFFSHGFKNCLSYYNTHFVDFFCLFALVLFGFSGNLVWLFFGRLGVGFMAGIQGKVSSVSALLFTDYASYEISVGTSVFLFSTCYWSSFNNIIPNGDSIPASAYFEVHPAAIGTLFCLLLLFIAYIVYFIRKLLYQDSSRNGYVTISDVGRSVSNRSMSRNPSTSYHLQTLEDDSQPSYSETETRDSIGDITLSEQWNQIPNRYLRGCNGDIEEATRRWHLTLEWRREAEVDGILEEPQLNFFKIKECYPHFFHGRSKDGHPVYFERVGYIDKKRLASYSITVPMLLRHYIFITEYLWGVLDPDEDHGASISVMDVENVGLRDLMGETLEFLSQSSKIIQGHYVERCHKIFILNAPFFFNAVWKAVSPLVHENTRKKISILGSNRAELLEYIDASQLPAAYGGTGGPLGSSVEEKDLAAYVKSINSTQFTGSQPVPVPVAPTEPTVTIGPREDASVGEQFAESTPPSNSSYISYFTSTVSTMVSAAKNAAYNAFDRPEYHEAFLGTKNEYIYDERSNAWVLYSADSRSSTPEDSPVFSPRDYRSGTVPSQEAAASVTAPLLGVKKPSFKGDQAPKEHGRSGLSADAISAILSMRRKNNGAHISEFTALLVVLLIFQASLIYILELIPVWLYLSDDYGGCGFSVANVGGVISASALVAAIGLYLAGYPKHIVYTPVLSMRNDDATGAEITTVELREQDRYRESRAISASPHPKRRGASQSDPLANRNTSIAHVSLQSLFWLGLTSQFLSILFALILLPLYFRDIPAWPGLNNVLFHCVLCLIVSSTIFSLAAVYECILVTKKASAISSTQDMKLTLCISVASMFGSFMAPLSLYLIHDHYENDSATMVGIIALAVAEAVVFSMCLLCYIRPPKYPLYFYA